MLWSSHFVVLDTLHSSLVGTIHVGVPKNQMEDD